MNWAMEKICFVSGRVMNPFIWVSTARPANEEVDDFVAMPQLSQKRNRVAILYSENQTE